MTTTEHAAELVEPCSVAMYKLTSDRYAALLEWGVRLLACPSAGDCADPLRRRFEKLAALQQNDFQPHVGKRRKLMSCGGHPDDGVRLWTTQDRLCDFLCRHLSDDLTTHAVEWALLPELAGALHGLDDSLETQRPSIYRIGKALEACLSLRLNGGLRSQWLDMLATLRAAVNAHEAEHGAEIYDIWKMSAFGRWRFILPAAKYMKEAMPLMSVSPESVLGIGHFARTELQQRCAKDPGDMGSVAADADPEKKNTTQHRRMCT